MARFPLASCLVLSACASAPGSPDSDPAPVRASDAPPARVALLVGIDRYAPGSGVGELRGAVRDAERVRELLTGRFGFADEDVVLLADEHATHSAIVTTFAEHLVARSGPGAEAVFYFAGHGSRVPDAARSDGDGLDASLLAHDSRADGRAGEYDLVDDALRSLVSAVEARGGHATVVLDACHAGGVLRGRPAFRTRTAPQGVRPYDHALARGFWPTGVTYYDGPPPQVFGSSISIGAADRDQVAGELDVETVFGTYEPTGVLTWSLGQRLQSAGPDTTWREVVDGTALSVATLLPFQDVVWTGALDRTVFGGGFDAGPAGFHARAVGADEIEVAAGWLHGLREGSQLDVRSADGRRTFGGAVVERLAATTARARFARPPPSDALRTALRAVETGRPAGERPLALWCDVPGLAPWFAGSPWVGIAASLESADLVVRAGAGGYQLWTPDGVLVPGYLPILPPTFADQGRWLALCEPILRGECLWRATSRLALESGAIELDVALDAPTAEELRAPLPAGWNRWVPADLRGRRVAGGARGELPMGVFRVRNPGDRPVRLAVLNLAEDARTRRVLEPAAGREARVLAPGETCAVRVGFPSPARWDLARPMLDRYLFLATYAPFDAWTLASEVELRGDAAPLPGILRQAEARFALRGAGPIDLDRSGIGLRTIDVRVDVPR